MGDVERRRRRHRQPADRASASPSPAAATAAGEHGGDGPARGRRDGPEESERGLRGLVGSGSSQVSVTAAMRARDAGRPTAQDLADAEARVVLVRRNWIPREDLPRR
ncbi:hypothetical protein [Salinispora arenicola]|uniref:hypothetical protein n=1 Tax=Salinispora arenicola TaxID=168697 RepID=UPI000381771E|nr:hypothetical protein [Salinispora arenicola]MCN0155076.1 hypothetical protein [Salinispora arenicola]MCN0180260.1 hypothetical protein [Salinispora arenicola]NIL58594.1 hypothetical protein [Salinispora arenicola]NIL64072.1 hypothetical protein [Salinispora arenicola]